MAPSKSIRPVRKPRPALHEALAAARACLRSWQWASCRSLAAAISARINSAAVAAGICLAAASVRHFSSIVPSLSPRSPITTRSGNPDQVGVLEFHTRTLIAIVGQDFEPGGRQRFLEGLRLLQHGRVLDLQRHDHDLVRRQRQRPDDPVGVVPAFDGAGQDPVDADAVTAHDRVDLGSLLVEVGRPHRLRILGAELEDVADFQAGLHLERACRSAGRHRRLRRFASRRRARAESRGRGRLRSGARRRVSADDDRRHRGDGRVDHERDLDADGPQETHRCPGRFLDRRRVGRDQDRRPDDPAELGLVQLVVAAQERGDGLAVGEIDQQLARRLLLRPRETRRPP